MTSDIMIQKDPMHTIQYFECLVCPNGQINLLKLCDLPSHKCEGLTVSSVQSSNMNGLNVAPHHEDGDCEQCDYNTINSSSHCVHRQTIHEGVTNGSEEPNVEVDRRAEDVVLDRRQQTNYLRNLSKKCNGHNVFNIPWGGVIIRNCDKAGEFLDFKTVQDYRRNYQNFWTELIITVFRNNDGRQFVEYVCKDCRIMRGIEFMDIEQNEVIMSAKRCHHSNACRRKLSEDVDDYLDTTAIPNTIEARSIFTNENIEEVTLRNDSLFLACYQNERKISILYTVTSRQVFPICSRCHHDKCPCFRKYSHMKRSNECEEANEDVNEVVEDPLPWDKITHSLPTAHYDAPIPLEEYYNEYGTNLEEIKYPIGRDKQMQKLLRRRMSSGIFDLPKQIIAKYDGHSKCKHSNKFDPEKKEIISQNVIIHTDKTEQLFDVAVYGLQTEYVHGERPCNCIYKPDCNYLLLWHLGGGEMVDYLTLFGFIQEFCHGGLPMDTFWKSREAAFKSMGLKSSSLKKENWNKAVRGFVNCLQYSKDIWICPHCKDTPPYLVADGKFLGPAKRKVIYVVTYFTIYLFSRIIINLPTYN